MNVTQAYKWCLDCANSHYENFPVASKLVPKKARLPIAAVYAFSRIADDFADEAEFEGVRLQKLDGWLAQFRNRANADHPVFIALHEVVEKYGIPPQLFEDLITAFKMDLNTKRYANFNDLLYYCKHSANPVGRIVLYILGYPAPKFLEYSDSICTALQLANFWQDVSVDLEKGRIYLPQEDMVRFQVTSSDLTANKVSDSLNRLLLYQVQRTRLLFEEGKKLCGLIPGRMGVELRLTWLGGMAILDRVEVLKGNVIKERPKLGKLDFARLLLRALLKKNFL